MSFQTARAGGPPLPLWKSSHWIAEVENAVEIDQPRHADGLDQIP